MSQRSREHPLNSLLKLLFVPTEVEHANGKDDDRCNGHGCSERTCNRRRLFAEGIGPEPDKAAQQMPPRALNSKNLGQGI
jgi:hypothetical protein